MTADFVGEQKGVPCAEGTDTAAVILCEGGPANTESPDAAEAVDAKSISTIGSAAHDTRLPPLPSPPPPAFMYLMAACAALNSTNIGFDIGVSSGVALLLQEEWQLSDGQVGLFMGSIHFMAALGGLCSQGISDRLGRRLTFAFAQGVLLVGLALKVSAPSFGVLMVGRVIVGLAVGFGLAIDPLYIAELAPAAHRGRLTSWPEIAINFGILLGFFANWLFSGVDHASSWRIMVACGMVLPVALLVLSVKVMPESPRWLVTRDQAEAAAAVLGRTHPPGDDVKGVVAAIRDEIAEDAASARLGWAPLLRPDAPTRAMLVIGIGVAAAQQINGCESVIAYSPTIFKRANVATTESSLFALTMLVGFAKTAFIVVAAHFVDTTGRRPLLILSTAGMTVCLAALSLAMAMDVGWLAVAAVCSFVAVFSLGIGPITWLLAAEVFPSRIRAKAMSLATFTNRCTSGMVCLTFLPLSDAIGGQAQYFGLFAVLTGLTAVAAWALVPETKQKTLEQLHQHKGKTPSPQDS